MHASVARAVVNARPKAGRSVDFVGIAGPSAGYLPLGAVSGVLRDRLPGWRFVDNAQQPLRGDPRAQQIADVIRTAESCPFPPEVLVVLRDTDGGKGGDVLGAIERARNWFATSGRKTPRALVLGAPHPEVEAWVIRGLRDDPAAAPKRARASETLRFDPCGEPERSTSSPDDALTDSKRVLQFLRCSGETLGAAPPTALPPAEHADVLARAVPTMIAADTTDGTGLAAFVHEARAALATP
jgi:hypothetical protein